MCRIKWGVECSGEGCENRVLGEGRRKKVFCSIECRDAQENAVMIARRGVRLERGDG